MIRTSARMLILNEIEARLNNISLANGYTFDPKSIRRGSKTVPKSHELPSIDFRNTSEISAPNSYGNDFRTMPMVIMASNIVRDANLVDTSSAIADDLYIGLTRATTSPGVDSAVSADLGGLVCSLDLTTLDAEVGGGALPLLHVWITVAVKYETPIGDPMTLVDP